MTVKELINALKKAHDINIAKVSFYIEGDELNIYKLMSLGQFNVVPDVIFNLKKINESEMKLVSINEFSKKTKKTTKKIIKKIRHENKRRIHKRIS